MKFYRRMSLRQQIRLLFGLAALLILGAGVCFYHIAYRSLCSREERYTYNIQAQVARRMEDITVSIDLLSDSVASSTATKSLLLETSSVKRWEYQRTLSTYCSTSAYFSK